MTEEIKKKIENVYKHSSNSIEKIEAAKFGYSLASQEHREEWVSVEERLPEANVDVLVIHNDRQFNTRRIGRLDTIMPIGSTMPIKPIFCLDDGIYTPKVTHWQPLPKPPKTI